MTILLRIVASFWLAAILVVVTIIFGITWARHGWSAASALLDPTSAGFVGIALVSAPGIGLLAFASLLDRQR